MGKGDAFRASANGDDALEHTKMHRGVQAQFHCIRNNIWNDDDDDDDNRRRRNKHIDMYTHRAIVAHSPMAQRAQAGLVTPIAATPGPPSDSSDAGSNRAATNSFPPPETSLAQDMTRE